MMRLNPLFLWCGLFPGLALWGLLSDVLAQSSSSSEQEAKWKLWNQLSESERKELRGRYRAFRNLPDEQRRSLRLRHLSLQELYEEVQDESEQETSKLSDLKARNRLRNEVRARLQNAARSWPERFPELEEAGTSARAWMRRASLEVEKRFEAKLEDMARRGIMDESSKSRWKRRFVRASLVERVVAMRELMLRYPRVFQLDRSLATRIRNADIISFARFLGDYRRQRTRLAIPRAFQWTDSQIKRLRAASSDDRVALRSRFLRENVRRVLSASGVPEKRLRALLKTTSDRELVRRARVMQSRLKRQSSAERDVQS